MADGSDAELFAKAFRWWGEQLQARVTGEYAVAIFDEQRQGLFLTHDALGVIPLFYSYTHGELAFASHLEDLACQTVDYGLDEEYIADYLALGQQVSDRTPYPDIRRLPAGQSLRWTPRQLTKLKTWDLAQVRPLRLEGDAEYEVMFRSLLLEGITSALRSDGSVWSELSGGLDSSSVVSMAAHSGAGRLATLSMIYSRSDTGDERPWMRAVVEKYSLPWHTIDVDEARPFSELPEDFFAEPNSVMPVWGLRRRYLELMKTNQVKVMLTGIGGDHVFGGDSFEPHYLADSVLGFQFLRLWFALRKWQRGSAQKRPLRHWFVRNTLRPLFRYFRGQTLSGAECAGIPPWMHPEYIRAMQLNGRGIAQWAPKCRSVGEQYFYELLWNISLIAGSNRDQYAGPFEFRHPLLYRPLVEFMFAAPWEQKIRPELDRHLQRRALKGILPEKVRRRRGKRGAEQAHIEGFRNGKAWIDLLTTRPRIVERGYVDAQLWAETVTRARFGQMHTMKHFMAVATLEVWLRQLERFRRSAPRSALDHFEPDGSEAKCLSRV